MNFIEKVKAAEINEVYDMSLEKMRKIIDATAGDCVREVTFLAESEKKDFQIQ